MTSATFDDPRGLRPVHPVEHPANDKSSRLWFPILVAAASRRSSPAEKSLRTLTAAGMARILPAPWNQLSPKYGIPASYKRRPLVLVVLRTTSCWWVG